MLSIIHDDASSCLNQFREFGMRHISIDSRPLRERHANYFARYATDCDKVRQRGDDPNWIIPLQAEHHNFHAALSWSLEDGGDATVGAQLALALTEFYRHDSRSAARSWFGLRSSGSPMQQRSRCALNLRPRWRRYPTSQRAPPAALKTASVLLLVVANRRSRYAVPYEESENSSAYPPYPMVGRAVQT
jgi:hypothetical protein